MYVGWVERDTLITESSRGHSLNTVRGWLGGWKFESGLGETELLFGPLSQG